MTTEALEALRKHEREHGVDKSHIDYWLDNSTFIQPRDAGSCYAHLMFSFWRMPAYVQEMWKPFFADKKLYCTWKGTRWEVTGASRMGDIWLLDSLVEHNIRDVDSGNIVQAFSNFGKSRSNPSAHYKYRVSILECSQWSNMPTWLDIEKMASHRQIPEGLIQDTPRKKKMSYEDLLSDARQHSNHRLYEGGENEFLVHVINTTTVRVRADSEKEALLKGRSLAERREGVMSTHTELQSQPIQLPNSKAGVRLTDWIMDEHCAFRAIEGTDYSKVENRVAFIEKTPRIRMFDPTQDLAHNDSLCWVYGPKGSSDYGKDLDSRAWCDDALEILGYILGKTEERPIYHPLNADYCN